MVPTIYTREYWRFKKNIKNIVYPPTIWSRPWSRPYIQGNIEDLKESKKGSLPTYNMVAIMVPTIYTRENWTFFESTTAGGRKKFTTRNSSYCNSFTFGNLRIHPHSEGDPGGASLEKNGGVTPTVRGIRGGDLSPLHHFPVRVIFGVLGVITPHPGGWMYIPTPGRVKG